jgi:hypothetical protein
VFVAASEAEANEWVGAIAVNAQHVGAAQHEPQCIVLPSHREVATLARAVAQRRRFLTDSGAAESQGLAVDLSASARGTLEEAAAAAEADLMAAEIAAAADEEELQQENEMAAAAAAAAARRGPPSPGAVAAAAAPAAAATTSTAFAADADAFASGGSLAARMTASLVEDAASPPVSERSSGSGDVTLAEAEALASAMGEASDEFLSQLPPDVAVALRDRLRGAQSSATPFDPALTAIPHPSLAPLQLEEFYLYVDDSGVARGPYSEREMRAWLLARFFGAHTLVRANAVHDDDAGGDAVPTHFLPLATLFPDPRTAFTAAGAWRVAYRAELAAAEGFRELEAAALALGLDATSVGAAVSAMRSARAKADLGTLLDVAEEQRHARERQLARASVL